jgi:propionyl-CoA carboxylase alpha chain
VEFLADQDKGFYFLEMNTRLQVEHPVTELITGRDLAVEQIRIASGGKLSFGQDDIKIRGHAIECRVYAEDPSSGFLPSTGTLRSYQEPAGPGIRVDSGVYEGAEISVFYDPMISKLLSYGKDRKQAIARMLRALSEYRISGVATNIEFHKDILVHPEFVAGNLSTHFIDEYYKPGEEPKSEIEEAAAVAAALSEHEARNKLTLSPLKKNITSPWKTSWRPGSEFNKK